MNHWYQISLHAGVNSVNLSVAAGRHKSRDGQKAQMGTVTKALELLNLFSRTKREIGLGEFVRLTGRDKATAHRHLVELEQNGFLDQDPVTRAYRLGPAILRLAGVREATHPARSVLRPIVGRLSEEVGELVHASLLQGEMLSPVLHADPHLHGTQVHFDEAELLPLHATSSGLAVLAFAPEPFRHDILAGSLTAYTGRTITDRDALAALVDRVRESGICQLEQAFDSEVTSQAAPVFGPGGEVAGALSVAIPSVRATPEKLASVTGQLAAGVLEATRAMGGAMPPDHAAKWEALAAASQPKPQEPTRARP